MSLEIQSIENINEDDIKSLIYQSNSSWFHHTEQWRMYTLNMRDDGSSDLSFGVVQNNKLVAFAPLVKEYIFNSKGKDEFSMAGLPSVYPMFSNTLSANNKEKIEKFIFKHIFNIAKKENISYMNFYVSPLGCAFLDKEIVINPLPKFDT